MAQTTTKRHTRDQDSDTEGMEALRNSPTMARLLETMEAGKDIGHFGQFTFATVARHFLDDPQIIGLLARQPDMDEEKAHALLLHVQERGYNPPRRERILEHQQKEGFPIIANPENPDSGNLYRELAFPDSVYEDINEYYEEKAEAEEKTTKR
jgi:hypothetical protein